MSPKVKTHTKKKEKWGSPSTTDSRCESVHCPSGLR